MNSVERVKSICKDRKIPISKLEKDLGFSNGYVGQLKKGSFPADRLASIAEYLSVSQKYLLTGDTEKPAPTDGDGLGSTKYADLSPENRSLVDSLIEKLYKSQSED